MLLEGILHYIELCKQGGATLAERLQIIQEQKARTYEQLEKMKAKIAHQEEKEQMYERTIASGDGDCCNPVVR